MENKLNKAVNSIGGVHPDWGPLTCFRMGFKEGAKWQKENMWISVKDSLPTNEDPVITLHSHAGVHVPFMNSFIAGKWTYEYGLSRYITHWMPIPQLKKGE